VGCKGCGEKRHYKLGDGRRKCVACGKKYTTKSRNGKLTRAQLKEIARLFWLLVPASRVAKDLKLNHKTVCTHYNRMRLRIAQESALVAAPLGGEVEVDESYFGAARPGKRGRGAGGKIPVFGLLKRGGEVRVVFPESVQGPVLRAAIRENVEPQSWVYTDRFTAYNQVSLDGFHHERIDHSKVFATGRNHINGIENFWGFAKRRLKMYHGGFKKNFPLFMKEMEFRFNQRDNDNVVELLTKMLMEETSGPA